MKRIGLLLALLGGCSFATHGLATSPTSCNPSRFAPGWDTYNAIGGGVLAITMADAADGDALAAFMAAGGVVLGSLHAAGAVYGFRHARACRELRAAPQPPQPPAILVPAEEPPPIVIEEDEESTTTTRTKRTIIVPTY